MKKGMLFFGILAGILPLLTGCAATAPYFISFGKEGVYSSVRGNFVAQQQAEQAAYEQVRTLLQAEQQVITASPNLGMAVINGTKTPVFRGLVINSSPYDLWINVSPRGPFGTASLLSEKGPGTAFPLRAGDSYSTISLPYGYYEIMAHQVADSRGHRIAKREPYYFKTFKIDVFPDDNFVQLPDGTNRVVAWYQQIFAKDLQELKRRRR